MRRFIKNIGLFLAFSTIFYIIAVIAWAHFMPANNAGNIFYPTIDYGNLHLRMKEVKGVQNIDLLILGSSHAYRGFDTRIFQKKDIKTFNLGSMSQTPVQTKLLVERYISQLNPKMVIYEVYPDIFTNDGVESSLNFIAYSDIGLANKLKMAFMINNIKIYNTLIYGVFSDLVKRDKYDLYPKGNDGDTYINGGFVERKLTYNLAMEEYGNVANRQFKEYQIKAFEEILKIFKKNNIRYLLVQTPVTSRLYNSYIDNDQMDRTFEDYGDYLNFNSIMTLNDSIDFYDSNHLNQNGVNKFNLKLLDLIDWESVISD
jgi:hypothetical protein